MDVGLPPARRTRLALAVSSATVGCLLAGCGGTTVKHTSTAKAQPSAGKAVVNPHYGAPGARIAVLHPTTGAIVGEPLRVKVKVTGFRLAPAQLDKAPKRGEGSLQFSMDGGKYDSPRYTGVNGGLAVKLGVAGRYSPAVVPSITYKGLPAGKHTLVVSLANNDLSETGVRARVVFTVR